MRSHTTLTILIFLLFSFSLSAQESGTAVLDAFSGKLITSLRTHERHIAYLVTDKSVFESGETIWFKASVVNSVSQRITNRVTYLFVDLVNEKDSVIKLQILDAANQQLSGQIALPVNLPEGYYWLRAYTRYMAENDPNSLFVKSIYVANKIEPNRFASHKTHDNNQDNSLNIGFYPEGGAIMTGINSTVTLRSTDKNGTPVSLSGIIKDNLDTVVAKFTTNSAGLAKFEFEPSRYRKYRAVFNYDGKDNAYSLPPFNFFAGQIAVTNLPAALKLRILLEDSIFKKNIETYVVGICRDSLVFAGIGKGLYEVFVDKHKLPDGITTFYLFDKSFNMLSERSVYIRENNIRVTASTDKNIYSKKDKVSINISITDAEQHPVQSLLTVSVTDSLSSAAIAENKNAHPGTKELMVDNNFMAVNEGLTDEERDLLMMTRVSSFQSISKTVAPASTERSDSLLYIKGTVFNEKKEISPNSVVSLMSNSGTTMIFTDTTDSKGRFRFPIDNYSDSTLFSLQVRDTKGFSKNKVITIDPIELPHVSTAAALKQYVQLQTSAIKKYFNTYKPGEVTGKTLETVIVRAKAKVTYDETKRVSSNSAIITSEDLIRKNNIKGAILSIGGLQIINGYLAVNGPSDMLGKGGQDEPLVLLDGVVQSVSFKEPGESSSVLAYLNTLNPKEIDFIEVLKGPEASTYGLRGGNGVILVNTLSKLKELKSNEPGGKVFYAKGIATPVLFPKPDYGIKNLKTPVTTDNRSTLYWNGTLLSDVNNRAALSFYTSDIPATYKVTISGITVHGDVIFKTIYFQSK